MKHSLLLLLLALSGLSFGQSNAALEPRSTVDNSEPSAARYPHPYVYGGLQLNGAGYSPTAWLGGAGLNIELKHLIFDSSASYDTAHKTNDNTVNNDNGHDRNLEGNAFFRLNRFYLGGGASWSELSTTNYTKQAWHPDFGVGRDWLREDFSLRGQVLYLLPGTDHLNAAQGPEFSLWLPSPATAHHFFFRDTVGIYEFHTTITDPSDVPLTAAQTRSRSVTGFANLTLMYRF